MAGKAIGLGHKMGGKSKPLSPPAFQHHRKDIQMTGRKSSTGRVNRTIGK